MCDIPAGMVAVSQDEFYRRLAADPRNIMPRLRHPESTSWETWDGVVFGWSYPGWRNPAEPKVYAVRT